MCSPYFVRGTVGGRRGGRGTGTALVLLPVVEDSPKRRAVASLSVEAVPVSASLNQEPYPLDIVRSL